MVVGAFEGLDVGALVVGNGVGSETGVSGTLGELVGLNVVIVVGGFVVSSSAFATAE